MMAHVAFVVRVKLSPAGCGGMESLGSFDHCRWLTLLVTADKMELSMLRMVGKRLRYRDLKRGNCREENGI